MCYNFNGFGGDYFEKIYNDHNCFILCASPLPGQCLGSREHRWLSSSTCMALYSICGTAALYCGDAACQGGMVGIPSAACGPPLDPGHGGSLCRHLRGRRDGGNRAGMYSERLSYLYHPVYSGSVVKTKI